MSSIFNSAVSAIAIFIRCATNGVALSVPWSRGCEIVGRVTRVGSAVTRFREGDLAGVGCMVDSCRTRTNCKMGEEQFCLVRTVFTYNSPEKNTGRNTYGGYSNNIVVDEDFVLKISPKLNLAAAAPLLCAGIATYSPMRHYKVGPGQKVGVVSLGGLGHMGLKFAHSFVRTWPGSPLGPAKRTTRFG